MSLALLIIGAAVAVAAVLIRTRYWELGPCPRCSGRGRGRWSKPRAYNRRCPKCGGSGERIRPLSLIWPQHREEARRRKEKRKGK